MKKWIHAAWCSMALTLMQATAWASDKGTDKSNGAIAGAAGVLVIVLGLGVYFLPTIIGFKRQKDNKMAILLLNFFLGWSLIGWVVALVWAVSKDKQPQTIIINNGPGNQ